MLTRLAGSRAGRAAVGLLAAGASATVVATHHPAKPTRYVTVPRGLAAMTQTQRSLLALANKYGPNSGIVYVWGGNSPGGFDCSGYVNYLYRKVGIYIPRDTRSQFYGTSGTHVPRGQERVGDAVYFHGSTSGVNAGPPPGHVGIYIGNGKFIEYYWTGHPAHVGYLGYSSGYMGAMRWYTPMRVPFQILGVSTWIATQWHLVISADDRWRVTFRRADGKRIGLKARASLVRWAHRHGHRTSGTRRYVTISL